MSYSLNSLKGLLRGLYRGRLYGLFRGLLGAQIMAHIDLIYGYHTSLM